MVKTRTSYSHSGLFVRLAHDRAGNTLAMIAAAVVPLLALLGGGIDMGRSYLSQSRLQQACDAGVLAARKKLGSAVAVTGEVPDEAATIGNRFFNLNFGNGSYGTNARSFDMTLEEDYAITGKASVNVPTTIMNLFGYSNMPIAVECEARLNFSNTDIMFVLDTTGSMNQTNRSDSEPKINILRKVVKSFHKQVEDSKGPGTRVRYGFLPYSTNVSVGGILKSDWLVDNWDYHGRLPVDTGRTTTSDVYDYKETYISGTRQPMAWYTAVKCPDSTTKSRQISYKKNADGSESGTNEINGTSYWCNPDSDGALLYVNGETFVNYRYSWTRKKIGTRTDPVYEWDYKKVNEDLAFLKGDSGDAPPKAASLDIAMFGSPSAPTTYPAYFRGCIEERDTYQIDDYDNVDLSRALDLDIDLVPTPGDPKTQWRPMLNEISWEPEIWWDGSGKFKDVPPSTSNDYLMAEWAGMSACPSAAQKLEEMDADAVASYVDNMWVGGSTYHDIGMIWGGRMLSPTGIFSGENADVSSKSTNRHMIFLTDGETAPLDLSYGTYGIEPLDKRRWSKDSPFTLTQTVENRFGVACNEVKKRNITVWVIGFGTSLNPIMTECAGEGHFFEAKDAAELDEIFSKIAAQMGELRISK